MIRAFVFDMNYGDSWFVAFGFLFFFLLPKVKFKNLKKQLGRPQNYSINFYLPSMKSFKLYALISFTLLFIYTSYVNGLYNPRIGSEEAASRASQLNIISLLVFKSYALLYPIVTAILIREVFLHKKTRLLIKFFSIIYIFTILFFLGGLFARASIVLLFVFVAIFLQNNISSETKSLLINYSLLTISTLVGLLVFVRYSDMDTSVVLFIESQFLSRLDGLEILSLLIESKGISFADFKISILSMPLIALIPFFPGAQEIKESGLTSIKSNMLLNDFNITVFDINSFSILDIYYIFGFLGVVFFSSVVSFLSLKIDNFFGTFSSRTLMIASVAFIMNVMILEREAIGIFTGSIRDFIVLSIVAFLFLNMRSSQHKFTS